MSDQFDFEESELFHDEPNSPHDVDVIDSCDHDDDDKLPDAPDFELDTHTATGSQLLHISGSAQSSTLHQELDAKFGSQGSPEPETVSHFNGSRQAMPVRLGSSLPIAVPNMGKWRNEPTQEPGELHDRHKQMSFVPPHELLRGGDSFSLASSARDAMRREKLRTRNAVLRETGFLEGDGELLQNTAVQERKRMAQGGLAMALNPTQLNSIVEQ